MEANIAKEARLITDEATHYKPIGSSFSDHKSVSHARGEYVLKSDRTVNTQSIEGFFGIFKRGMRGVYQHCDKKHLHRYMREFDFRYSNRSGLGINDDERRDRALSGAAGRRLLYSATA